jgi:hypothetical protein
MALLARPAAAAAVTLSGVLLPLAAQTAPSPQRPVVVSSDTLVSDAMASFGRIGTFAITQSGIWVTDLGLRQVAIVNLTTSRLQVVGKEGSGPGEFKLPLLLTTCGNQRVVVYDPISGRLTAYSPSGTLLDATTITIRVVTPKSIACDSTGVAFLSGVAVSRQARKTVLHRFANGRHLGSVIDASPAFPSEEEQVHGDGGPLVVNPGTNTIWFARTGPRMELTEVTPDGTLQQRIPLPRLDPTWSPRWRLKDTPMGLQKSAMPQLGAIYLMVVTPDTLLSISLMNDNWQYRFALFRMSTGRVLTTWDSIIPPDRLRPVRADGKGAVFMMPADGTALVVRQRWKW